LSLSFPLRDMCVTQATMPHGFFTLHGSCDERLQPADERIVSG